MITQVFQVSILNILIRENTHTVTKHLHCFHLNSIRDFSAGPDE